MRKDIRQLEQSLRRYAEHISDESGRITSAIGTARYLMSKGRRRFHKPEPYYAAALGKATWSSYKSWLADITIPGHAPSPTPVSLDVKAQEIGRAKRRQKSRRRGRAGTILTGGGLGGRGTTLLGGSA